MDYFSLKTVSDCLSVVLEGGHLLSCAQPEDRMMAFTIRLPAGDTRDALLVCDCSSRHAGLYLYPGRRQDNDDMTLLSRAYRKKLAGATIQTVFMPYPDRAVVMGLSLPEWGEERELWIEFHGVQSNISLISKSRGIILECLTKYPEETRIQPIRMPGRLFVSFNDHIKPRPALLADLAISAELWPETDDTEQLAAILFREFAPMTPEFSKQLARLKILEGTDAACSLIQTRLATVSMSVNRTYEQALAFLADNGRNREKTQPDDHLILRLKRLRQVINQALRRNQRKIAALESDLANLPDSKIVRKQADLLAINFHKMHPGMKQIDVADIFEPGQETLTIGLDPGKNPDENLKWLYKRAAKTERAGPMIKQRLKILNLELSTLSALYETSDTMSTSQACEEIEQRMALAGFKLDESSQSQKDVMLTRKLYLRFTSPDGWNIWVGRSARENDLLSFRDSAPLDFWLHAQGFRGAHVIIKNPQKLEVPPRSTIEFAARLAVRFSKARGEKAVSVLLTKRKYIRRVPGDQVGLVRVSRHETVMINSE